MLVKSYRNCIELSLGSRCPLLVGNCGFSLRLRHFWDDRHRHWVITVNFTKCKRLGKNVRWLESRETSGFLLKVLVLFLHQQSSAYWARLGNLASYKPLSRPWPHVAQIRFWCKQQWRWRHERKLGQNCNNVTRWRHESKRDRSNVYASAVTS